jgi:O-antigen ligase
MIVPSGAVIGSLGSIGAPSTILAIVVFVWWMWHHVHRAWVGQQAPQWVRRAAILLIFGILTVYRHAAMGPMVSDEIQPLDTGLIRFLALMGVILTASDGISSVERWNSLMDRMASATVMVSLLGILQFLTGELWIDRIPIPGLTNAGAEGLIVRGAFLRPSGTSRHPLEMSAALGMMLPIVINRARFSSRGRIQAFGGVGAVLFVVLLSVSRTALICTVVAIVILVPTWPRATRRLAIVWSVVLLAGASVAIPGLLGSLRSLLGGSADDPSVASRTSGYGYALEMFLQNPWLGRGYGTFHPRYHIFDNGYLQLLMETGGVGVGLFLLLLLLAIFSAHRASKLFSAYRNKEMARALVASVSTGAVSVAFFDLFAFPQSASCLVLSIGLSGAALRLARADAQVERSTPSEGVVSVTAPAAAQ